MEAMHLKSADVRGVPWKNGRGTTREFAVWPENASFERGDFDWRLSNAPVDEAGPFSALPGFERILVVTVGDELLLDHGSAAPPARLMRLDPYRFDGGWPTSAELPCGPIADFNVMLRTGRAQAEIEVVKSGARDYRTTLVAEHAFVHMLAGGCTARVAGDSRAFDLDVGDSLWLRDVQAGSVLECSERPSESELLIVTLGKEHPLF